MWRYGPSNAKKHSKTLKNTQKHPKNTVFYVLFALFVFFRNRLSLGSCFVGTIGPSTKLVSLLFSSFFCVFSRALFFYEVECIHTKWKIHEILWFSTYNHRQNAFLALFRKSVKITRWFTVPFFGKTRKTRFLKNGRKNEKTFGNREFTEVLLDLFDKMPSWGC